MLIGQWCYLAGSYKRDHKIFVLFIRDSFYKIISGTFGEKTRLFLTSLVDLAPAKLEQQHN